MFNIQQRGVYRGVRNTLNEAMIYEFLQSQPFTKSGLLA